MCIIFLPPCSNCLHNSHVFLTADWSKSVLFELPSHPSPERRRQLGSSLSASHREFFDKRDDNKTKVGLLLLLLLLLQAEVKKKKPRTVPQSPQKTPGGSWRNCTHQVETKPTFLHFFSSATNHWSRLQPCSDMNWLHLVATQWEPATPPWPGCCHLACRLFLPLLLCSGSPMVVWAGEVALSLLVSACLLWLEL